MFSRECECGILTVWKVDVFLSLPSFLYPVHPQWIPPLIAISRRRHWWWW